MNQQVHAFACVTVLVAALGFTNSAFGRSLHRSTVWEQGSIVSVDPASRTLVLSSKSNVLHRCQWTSATLEWPENRSLKRPGAPVNPDELAPGKPVAVLFRKAGKSNIAERIILNVKALYHR